MFLSMMESHNDLHSGEGAAAFLRWTHFRAAFFHDDPNASSGLVRKLLGFEVLRLCGKDPVPVMSSRQYNIMQPCTLNLVHKLPCHPVDNFVRARKHSFKVN